MPSLPQLLAAHGTLLVLDAASARVQTGWLGSGQARWASSGDEAAKAIFLSVETLLGAPSGDGTAATHPTATTHRSIGEVGAFVFCEGPGSILGIRSAATAIRTWAALCPGGVPVYRYQSLALLAHALGDPALTLIADARREHWHAQRLGAPLRQVPGSELARTCAPCAMPEGFRHWSSPPAELATVAYDLEAFFQNNAVWEADLFAPAPEPDAFLHNAPSYKTWSPQIHRAPAPATAPAPAAPASEAAVPAAPAQIPSPSPAPAQP